MTKDQCVSVTELRTKTKECLENIEKKPKYVFINNKPIAVIIGIDKYEAEFLNTDLMELDSSKVDARLKVEAQKAKNLKANDIINI